jgi:hypothetical protein
MLLKTEEYIEQTVTEFNNIIWSATPDVKPKAKYPEYPLEVWNQIKEN